MSNSFEIEEMEDKEFLALGIADMELWNPPRREVCIYRVPELIRQVNPGAYTPRVLLIGPLHHSKKQEAYNMLQEKSTTTEMENMKYRYKRYLEMEKQKVLFYKSFCERVGIETVRKCKSYVEANEGRIRNCYEESTSWIKTSEFVRLIFLDSIFIIEYFLVMHSKDRVFEIRSLETSIERDIALLENQLPFFVLTDLYDLVSPNIQGDLSFLYLITRGDLDNHADSRVKNARHVTDLTRLSMIQSTNMEIMNGEQGCIQRLYSAKKLHQSGVEFVLDEGATMCMNVRFENKKLIMPNLSFQENTEDIFRNVMALEQCHYQACEAHMSSYALFLDFLIDTEKDVELLVEKGLITNLMGHNASVADTVDKLIFGHTIFSPYYNDMAERLNRHHDSFFNHTMAMLRGVYFSNLWTGTATVAGAILLVLTIIQTVASLIQVKQA